MNQARPRISQSPGFRELDMKCPNGQQNLVDWLRPILSNKRKLKDTMDVSIEGQYSSKAMMLAAQLSSKCIESDPKSRSSMEEVLEALEQIDAINEKPKGNKSSGSSTTSSRRSQLRTPLRSPSHVRS